MTTTVRKTAVKFSLMGKLFGFGGGLHSLSVVFVIVVNCCKIICFY